MYHIIGIHYFHHCYYPGVFSCELAISPVWEFEGAIRRWVLLHDFGGVVKKVATDRIASVRFSLCAPNEGYWCSR